MTKNLGRLDRYLLSLPERTVRAATAASAGLLRELGDAALPMALRRTNLYRTMVEGTLRFLIETVGEVDGTFPQAGKLDEDFLLRRAAGNGIEMAGILAFRASPVWVFAALADVSGASRMLIREIADSLKDEGLLDPDTEYETVDHVLAGLELASGRVAEAVNTPPLDVAGLRREWREIEARVRSIPPERMPAADRLWEGWRELRAEAEAQGRSVFQMSSLMAVSALGALPAGVRWLSLSAATAAKSTSDIFADALLDHYRDTLVEVRRVGVIAYWRGQFEPYLRAAAKQFSPGRRSLTERLLDRRNSGPPAR
jgi:hypothetical protein